MSQNRLEVDKNIGEYRVRLNESNESLNQDSQNAFQTLRASQLDINEEKAYRINGDELISSSKWRNPLIQLAVPLFNVLNGPKSENPQKNRTLAHYAMSRYQSELVKLGFPQDTIENASYLLCTYADELLQKRGRATENFQFKPLLIEFYGDSWGGEVVYDKLDSYLSKPLENKNIIELYYLVLSLGFKGKNSLVDHGELALSELLSRLHSLLYIDRESPNMYFLPTEDGFAPHWWTLKRAFIAALIGLSLLLGIFSYSLYQYNLGVRSEIAAYEPPVRVRSANIGEVLPDPLPQLIVEGWLTAKRVDGGWLLIVRSDGAFEVGSAEINQSFKENLVVLARAFQGKPGTFLVTGHTDSVPISTPRFPSNMELSLARAESTRNIFATESGQDEFGQPRLIDVDGKGSTEPVATNKTTEGRRANRRVEIFWRTENEDAAAKIIGEVVE